MDNNTNNVGHTLFIVVEGPFHDHGVRIDSVHAIEDLAQKRAKLLSKAYVVHIKVDAHIKSSGHLCIVYEPYTATEDDFTFVKKVYASYDEYLDSLITTQKDSILEAIEYSVGTFTIASPR